jgi:uncharacterized SAM-binding protein YcdF (DUF218 family)
MTGPRPVQPSTNWRELTARLAVGATLGGASWVIWSILGLAGVSGEWNESMFGVATLVGSVIGMARRQRVLIVVAGAGVAVGLVVAYTPIVGSVAPHFIRRDSRPAQRADAIVVLGAGTNREGLLDLRSLERMLSGLALGARDDTTPLVTSVIRQPRPSAMSTERDIRHVVALAGGRNVVLLTGVFSTRDEAIAVRHLATQRGWRLVTVVTSPSHSRRACATFERAGLTVHCEPSAERSFVLEHLDRAPDRLNGFAALVYEALGAIVYRLRGWA